jgi:hypothetical protein
VRFDTRSPPNQGIKVRFDTRAARNPVSKCASVLAREFVLATVHRVVSAADPR